VDYYASLGVARTSEDVVIRAAYLALMRRYHPDRNPTAEAAQRVREITNAYGVLGDPVRRRGYDRDWDAEEPNTRIGTPRRAPVVGPMAFGITMLFAAVVIWIIWARIPSPEIPSTAVAAAIRPETSNQAKPDVSCSSARSANLIGGELLRQASRVRADAQPVFAGLPDQLTVQTLPVTSLSLVSPGTIACSAVITVKLPLGVIHPDGRRALAGNVEYLIDRDRTGEGSSIQVTADDKFLLDLASLERSTSRSNAIPASRSDALPASRLDAMPGSRLNAVPVKEQAEKIVRNTIRSQLPLPPRTTSVIASRIPTPRRFAEPLPARDRPSRAVAQSNCQGDHWTRLICEDANLTALNHQLAVFEDQSVANAVGKKRELLQRSRAQFDSNRASCRTEACVQRALLARTTEVAGIMRSQTRPQQ